MGKNKYNQKLVLCKCKCGTERIVTEYTVLQNKSKSCGCLHKEIAKQSFDKFNETNRGENSPRWIGGKILHKRGYVFVLSPEHPRVQNRKNKYVQEHILVMEKKIGRYILPNETIHHKNGIKTDNRIENLELWSKNHLYGQRVEDLIKFAKEILSRYEGLMFS